MVNSVSVIGRVVGEPELRRNRAGADQCTVRLAVPRYSRNGQREPGVVYIDVTTFGLEAQDCARQLREGSVVGLSGRLDSDPPDSGIGVLIDQLDLL